jgi:hypothetical protein
MSVQASQSVGVKRLRSFTSLMSKKAEVESLLKLNGFGLKSSNLRLKQALLTCFTKTHATVSLTNKT